MIADMQERIHQDSFSSDSVADVFACIYKIKYLF